MPRNAFKRDVLTHNHVQRMTNTEVTTIDAECDRVNKKGGQLNRSALVRVALAAFFDMHADLREEAVLLYTTGDRK